jgi:hypothetical protein
MLYGQQLNRCTRVKPVLLTDKPLSNIVEATITRETGGVSPFPCKNGSPRGDRAFRRRVAPGPKAQERKTCFLPISEERGIRRS